MIGTNKHRKMMQIYINVYAKNRIDTEYSRVDYIRQ